MTVIHNPPGLATIRYRAGDFLSFRHALLSARPGETALNGWRPGAHGDLAVQLVEWWAVLGDILTFYNERILTQAFLRTADLPEAVANLVRLLGYRPRPGIAAHGEIAALIAGKVPVTIEKGFAVQSKGKTPQVFETESDITLPPGGALPVDPAPKESLVRNEPEGRGSILLAGVVTSIPPGERLLLRKRAWTGAADAMLLTVRSVAKETSPRGKKNTRVTFNEPLAESARRAADWLLLRPTQKTTLLTTTTRPITGSGAERTVRLEGTVTLMAGDALFLEGPTTVLAPIGGTSRGIQGIAQPPATADGGDGADQTPITVIYSIARIESNLDVAAWNAERESVSVSYGWTSVGTLIATPLATIPATGTVLLDVPAVGILEDAAGQALRVSAGTLVPPAPLIAPLQLLTNLIAVSRGKSVPREVLGSGNASVASQTFALAKSPLTYLQRGEGYASTLRIWVDGIEWQEKPSFYGQSGDARVFITREDAKQVTHVLFGDGIEGARVPTGRDNIVATYRYGSGEVVPEPGSLNVVLTPRPGVRGVRAPLPMSGGSEPDPPAKIRRYAPATMLALGRAVSGSDYEAIAAQAPGVKRVRASWSFDAARQRARIAIYVGDTPGAVASARTAILAARDPNRDVEVLAATPADLSLQLAIAVRGDFDRNRVEKQVRHALRDDDAGLFGANVVRIGQTFLDSQIYRACLDVPGVVAVHDLSVANVSILNFSYFLLSPYIPPEGSFFRLTNLNLRSEAA